MLVLVFETRLLDLAVDKKSRVAGNHSICGRETVWNPILRRHLHDWEITRVIELLARLQTMKVGHGSEDKRIWKAVSSGEFSVKSCYGHFDQYGQLIEVWYGGVPPKIQFFMWTAVLEKLSTMDVLWHKGFALPSICLLCYQDAESINHLLIHCPFAWEIWYGVSSEFGFTFVAPMNITNLLLGWRTLALNEFGKRL